MDKLSKIAKLLMEYWLFITIIGGGLLGFAKFLHDAWFIPNYVEPQVRQMSYQLYTDSSAVWREKWIESHKGGFGGIIAESFGMDKKDLSDSLAQMYFNEKGKDMSLTYLMDRMTYQVNFNTTLFLMCTQPYVYHGVKMRKTETKQNGQYDVYYKDGFDKWWKAIYYADEDAYYYIPDNSNGQRIKCD